MLSHSRHSLWTPGSTVPRVGRRAAAGLIVAALFAAGCGDGPDPSASQLPTRADYAATTSQQLTAPAPNGRAGELRDWIYEVVTEIPPGTYVTTVPADHPHPCYWARLRSFGQPRSVIDEGNPEPSETVRVTVLVTDRGFKVSNGCTWTPSFPL